MTIQQTIEKSIEGGWSAYFPNVFRGELTTKAAAEAMIRELPVEGILLDPSFWRALGKAMGWKESEWYPFLPSHPHLGLNMPEWKWYWHRFIDHLADGKSIESYFEIL